MFESLQERRENFLVQGQFSVLTLISVSVPSRCYRSTRGARTQTLSLSLSLSLSHTHIHPCYIVFHKIPDVTCLMICACVRVCVGACVRVCVCERARARVRVCVCVCVCFFSNPIFILFDIGPKI